jgi:hypothetical protein
MSITLSSIRIAVAIVCLSFAWSSSQPRLGLDHVREHVDRAEVAHGDLGLARVERDLGAEVARVDRADVLLRRAHVAGVLERDPRMPGLEEHREHLAPQLHRGKLLVELQLAARGLVLVALVRLLERVAELVVQVGHVGRREQRPVAAFHHAFHEQVGNPVRRVHVVRAPAVVAGVLAQLEELLDVEVPALEVRADRALALAALVDRDRGVVDDLQERHHALALAVGALDVRAHRAHVGPVVAQAAGELRQQRVFLDRLVDAVEVVGDGRQVARRKLRAVRARVEQRGRARHEVERREHVVELDRARLAVDLVQRQAHRHAHEEALRQLEAAPADVLVDEEVAVVQRLQAEVAELQVALGLERGAQRLHVVLQQVLVEEADLDAVLDEGREVLGVPRLHLGLRDFLAHRLEAQRVEQQARGDVRVRRILLDQRARGQHDRLADFLDRHAVVEVLERRLEDALRIGVGQARARFGDERGEAREIELAALAVLDHVDLDVVRLRVRVVLRGALLRALLAVQHVRARGLVLAAAHQRELDLVLDLLDVDRAAVGLALEQRADDRLGQVRDLLAHARGRRALPAVHGEERLGHRDRDLRRLEADDGAVAPDHLVLREARDRCCFASDCQARPSGHVGGGAAVRPGRGPEQRWAWAFLL